MRIINARRLLAAVAVVAAAAAATPAHAANATSTAGHTTVRATDDTCTPHTDSYSDDRWTSVRWRGCLGTDGGPNGYFQAKCWRGQTIGWSRQNCEVNGPYVIRDPQGNEVKSGNLNLFSSGLEEDAYGNAFRFNCSGRPHGAYTFTVTGAEAQLTGSYAHYQPAKIPDTTVTHTMC